MSRKTEPFRRIIGLARPELWPLLGATVALLGTAALTFTYPQLVRLIVDGVVGGGGAEVVDRYAVQLLGLFALTSVLTAVRMYLFTVAGERIVTRLRQRLYNSLIRQDIGFSTRDAPVNSPIDCRQILRLFRIPRPLTYRCFCVMR